jgi:hypothetical protein
LSAATESGPTNYGTDPPPKLHGPLGVIGKFWNFIKQPESTNVVIAIATVVIAIATWKTWGETQQGSAQTNRIIAADERIANAMESSVSQSQTSLKATVDQMRSDQRAWVGVSRMDGTLKAGAGPSTDKVEYINSGRSPALNLHVAFQTDCEPKGIRPKILYTEATAKGHFVLVPQQSGSIGMTIEKSVCSPKNTELMKARKARAYMLGTIWYNDVFGKVHFTDFCGQIEPGDTSLEFCDFHNEAN